MAAAAPTARAVLAFKVNTRRLRPLPGGQGQAWSDGRVVLKPVSFTAEHAWVCEVYASWTAHDVVRVPEPVKPDPDAWLPPAGWTVDGWAAHVFVDGRDLTLPDEIAVVKEASDAFHHAVAHLPRPVFLDERTDPWAFGDRVAWEGAEPEGDARVLALTARLRAALRPVSTAFQMIHGDILPNVLVSVGLPPAVIDWPPYCRPAAFANAIAATDAVTFRGASIALLDDWADGPDWDQLLVRALLYRLGPTGWFAARDRLTGSLLTHVHKVEPVVEAVLAR